MTVTKILPVQGTAGWPRNEDPRLPPNWWRCGSPLHDWLRKRDCDWLCPEDPFVWSGDLVGWRAWRRLFGRPEDLRDWRAGGKSGRWFATAKGFTRIPVAWVLSHGLQPMLFGAAEWHEPIFIERLVSFGSPLRDDVPWRQALPKIGEWLIVTDEFDLTQMLGRFGDGSIGNPEELLQRVTVKTIPGIDHSKLLQDPSYFELLETEGILAFTRGEERPVISTSSHRPLSARPRILAK